jgi:hypothetical protein
MNVLRSRRASHTASYIETQPRSIDDDVSKERAKALSSILTCFRTAFYSTAVDIFMEFSQPTLNITSLSFLIKLIQSLHILGFGIGLYQCTKVYEESIHYSTTTTSTKTTLSPDKLSYIFKKLSRMWFTSSIALLLGAMALSTNFADYLENNSLYYVAPALVFATAIVIALFVNLTSPQYTPDNVNTADKQAARKAGFSSLQNVTLCIGMLGVDAVTFLLDDFFEPNTSVIIKIYKLTSVSEPVAIAVLLWNIRQHSCRIVVIEMSTINCDTSFDLGNHRMALFQAQQEFYTKVG